MARHNGTHLPPPFSPPCTLQTLLTLAARASNTLCIPSQPTQLAISCWTLQTHVFSYGCLWVPCDSATVRPGGAMAPSCVSMHATALWQRALSKRSGCAQLRIWRLRAPELA